MYQVIRFDDDQLKSAVETSNLGLVLAALQFGINRRLFRLKHHHSVQELDAALNEQE